MWFPEATRRIYVDLYGRALDPLALRHKLIEYSGGLIWAMYGKRFELYHKLNDNPETGAEASAELELLQTERSLIRIARQVMGLASTGDLAVDRTDDEVLASLDHFICWLNEKKANTAA